MTRRPLLTAVTAAALALGACTSSGEGEDPPPEDTSEPTTTPTASAADLLLEEVPVGDGWASLEAEQVEDAYADRPPGSGVTFDPEDCADAALLTEDEEGSTADVAGLGGTTGKDTALPVLAVVREGYSAGDLRDAREDCATMTVTTGEYTSEQREEIGDGPEIEGADESFAFEGTYVTSSTGGGQDNSFTRYGIVAEVRETLVVVVANPEFEDPNTTTTRPITQETEEQVAKIAQAQVTEITEAN